MISVLFFVAVVAALAWTTVRGRDAWPFSHYPMFSSPADLDSLTVVRVALETQDGASVWWHSRFYRDPEYVGRQLQRVGPAMDGPESRRYVEEVMRLVRMEQGSSLDRYRAVRIVERRAEDDPIRGLCVRERLLARVALEELKAHGDGD